MSTKSGNPLKISKTLHAKDGDNTTGDWCSTMKRETFENLEDIARHRWRQRYRRLVFHYKIL